MLHRNSILPQIVIILDVSDEIATARLAAKPTRKVDDEGSALRMRAMQYRENLQEFEKRFGKVVVHVDSSGTVEEVWYRVKDAIEKKLVLRGPSSETIDIDIHVP